MMFVVLPFGLQDDSFKQQGIHIHKLQRGLRVGFRRVGKLLSIRRARHPTNRTGAAEEEYRPC